MGEDGLVLHLPIPARIDSLFHKSSSHFYHTLPSLFEQLPTAYPKMLVSVNKVPEIGAPQGKKVY